MELDETLVALDVLPDDNGSAGAVLAPAIIGFSCHLYELESSQGPPS